MDSMTNVVLRPVMTNGFYDQCSPQTSDDQCSTQTRSTFVMQTMQIISFHNRYMVSFILLLVCVLHGMLSQFLCPLQQSNLILLYLHRLSQFLCPLQQSNLILFYPHRLFPLSRHDLMQSLDNVCFLQNTDE